MADSLSQAYALNQRAMDPSRQEGLIRALSQRQSVGNALGTLSGGKFGEGLRGGPSPTEAYMDSEERARQAGYQNYMMERQQQQDAESKRRFGITTGLAKDKIGATLAKTVADKTEKQVANISKGMEKLQPLEQSYNQVAAMVASYGDENIPGVGFLEGGSGGLGKMVRLGGSIVGSRSQENYADVERMMAVVRRNAIGSQQTRSELGRIEQQIGMSGWEDENVFREAVTALGAAIQEEKRSIMSRGTPQAAEIYSQRSGVPLAPPPGEIPTAAVGSKYKILSVE